MKPVAHQMSLQLIEASNCPDISSTHLVGSPSQLVIPLLRTVAASQCLPGLSTIFDLHGTPDSPRAAEAGAGVAMWAARNPLVNGDMVLLLMFVGW